MIVLEIKSEVFYVNVLFVCLGNICRSPMAEAMFRQLVKEAGLSDQIKVDSAGLNYEEIGNGPHPGAAAVMHQHGLSTDGLIARHITNEDFERADYIICMDRMNLDELHRLAPKNAMGKIHLANEPVPGKENAEIPDPWYTHRFEDTYQSLAVALPHWLAIIRKQLN
nr:low molecular weight protein-tyrosine-phosphatase [Limosilactobacillus kribbianus]